MILLAVTSQGLADAKALAAHDPDIATWCSAEALSEQEPERAGRIPITRFSLPLKGNPHFSMEHAMDVIREHHPGKTVWVEANENG